MASLQNASAKSVTSAAKDLEAALQRRAAVEQKQAVAAQESRGNEIDHQNPPAAVSSDRPTYYATDAVYQTCKEVAICVEWAAQQAREEIHFQVTAASLVQKEDLHHNRLIVKYVKFDKEQEKVFEEGFNGWKEK